VALGSMSYVPVLKARDAEIEALLSASARLDVTPLFELQNAAPPTTDAATGALRRSKSTTTDASYFLDDIARRWIGRLYVDVSRVAEPAARGPWWALLSALAMLAAPTPILIPVLSDLEPSASRAQAAGLGASAGRAALRVQLPHPSPAAVAAALPAVASELGLNASDVDVILDWGDEMEPRFSSLDALESHTRAIIGTLGSEHGRLITVGTPNSADFAQVGDWQRTRREWWLWLRLAHAGLEVTYGDYALYPPADPVPAAPRYGHLRYSAGSDLYVHRRAIPAAGGGLKAAFAACCEHLVASSHFMGAGFSPADKRIADIAAKRDEMGQAGKWRQLSAEHHFAVVASQLSAPPSAPPPRTP